MKKVALITGGARGIGKCIVESLCKDGYIVVVNYFNSVERAMELEKELKKSNCECMFVRADISNEIQVSDMTNKIMKQYGRIDILINNSAITNDSTIHLPIPLAPPVIKATFFIIFSFN